MSRYWSPIIHNIKPYVPGEQPKAARLIKLNTNENPYGPSPKALKAIADGSGDALRLYPDPNADRVKAAMAEYYGLLPSRCLSATAPTRCWPIPFSACCGMNNPCSFRISPTVFTRFTAAI